MKQVKIFYQYSWIINTLKNIKRVTLEELKRLWILDEVADGSTYTITAHLKKVE